MLFLFYLFFADVQNKLCNYFREVWELAAYASFFISCQHRSLTCHLLYKSFAAPPPIPFRLHWEHGACNLEGVREEWGGGRKEEQRKKKCSRTPHHPHHHHPPSPPLPPVIEQT